MPGDVPRLLLKWLGAAGMAVGFALLALWAVVGVGLVVALAKRLAGAS